VLLVDADPGASTLEWSDAIGGFPFRMIGLPVRNLHEQVPQFALPNDVVIIDSGQLEDHAGIARSAMRLADEIVVPCAPTSVELSRTGRMLEEIANINPLRTVPARSCILLNRTVANAMSTDIARQQLTAAGFSVLGMVVPRLEMFAQSFNAPIQSAGPIWQVIAAELANRARLTEVAR